MLLISSQVRRPGKEWKLFKQRKKSYDGKLKNANVCYGKTEESKARNKAWKFAL